MAKTFPGRDALTRRRKKSGALLKSDAGKFRYAWRLLRSWTSSSFLAPAQCKGNDGVTVFLAGHMIVMRPFSTIKDPRFLELVEKILSADAAIVNLETLFHRFKGYPQADSGGTYMATYRKSLKI